MVKLYDGRIGGGEGRGGAVFWPCGEMKRLQLAFDP